jgi:hypothetical protein
VIDKVGRSPWTAADAPVGLHRSTEEPDQGSGTDEGRPPHSLTGLIRAAIRKHDLRRLIQVPAPVGPFVAAGAQDPKVANAVLV